MAIESSIRQKQTNNGVVEMLNKTKTGRLAVSTTPRQRLKRRDGESTSRPGPTHAQGRNPPSAMKPSDGSNANDAIAPSQPSPLVFQRE